MKKESTKTRMIGRAKSIRKRLLFVDDERSIRETLSAILRGYGFSVTVAGTVREAIKKIRTHKFDLLLSDLNIGVDGNGYTVVRALRQVNPRCVAIILTGYPGFDSAVEGIRQGIDDYLIKPTDVETLVARLSEQLNGIR